MAWMVPIPNQKLMSWEQCSEIQVNRYAFVFFTRFQAPSPKEYSPEPLLSHDPFSVIGGGIGSSKVPSASLSKLHESDSSSDTMIVFQFIYRGGTTTNMFLIEMQHALARVCVRVCVCVHARAQTHLKSCLGHPDNSYFSFIGSVDFLFMISRDQLTVRG